MNGTKAKEALLADLRSEGFSGASVTAPGAIPQVPARLRAFLDAGRHGTMDWMPETEARRGDPRMLWPEARSVVMAAFNYAPEPGNDPLAAVGHKDRATISVYAQNRDYHEIVKGKLKQAAGRFAARTGAQVKVFVDTAPLMEKPLAEAAGLGWQGKHTNLVSRRLGSWFFLGSIFTDLELPADAPERDHCGSCRACLDTCPTDAFPAPYQLDARRCISYLTIEHKGSIPHEFRTAMGNRIYGCDDCLAVCPWNKFAHEAREAKLRARDDLKSPSLESLLQLDDASFRTYFSGSPIKRIGRNRFLRNVLIAAGNSGDTALVAEVRRLLSDADPIVRGAAVWAYGRLAGPESLQAARDRHLQNECDEGVRAEWHGTGTGKESEVTHV
ncbi:tRNA epoxyqueuosine(34) reductase QueG [Oricola cellulosilytica]|uniref:Epoxyqueuosine reductase n=1 Tax=Oricola cellulosilytica TaxID=1429082 RepID=A0A4R0PG94_9HYPH|nr:tRNA epoxyqueuosine(34) reductase QueG [Oricola cellulosilytica]TCD16108.1 tRNA epoxyqueuosine(34) reductase QueG [Oricola cellulosilytica]